MVPMVVAWPRLSRQFWGVGWVGGGGGGVRVRLSLCVAWFLFVCFCLFVCFVRSTMAIRQTLKPQSLPVKGVCIICVNCVIYIWPHGWSALRLKPSGRLQKAPVTSRLLDELLILSQRPVFQRC